MQLDPIDRRILAALQRDATVSHDRLGEEVGLSRNACWRRVRALEDAGYIAGRVALVDPARIDLALTVFLMIRTDRHAPDWLDSFAKATREMPEVLGAYRMSGDLDYLVRLRVADVASYDRFYQRLIRRVEMADCSASFVMEELKETTVLPV
ncbi:Lrp/AsnC family transcriptional regulator [Roseobacter sp. HKCCA0434]|uniref:Lrp/AsnC family transcriptional regulator n=1 Tax=Roseobacter sp. HKCCA0434 TaxID=3079297 RepID=UPI002905A9BA|nr:Lrp/AsnC family transcriptional regulator [Roseobacter sp. HKCCA0434]